MISRKDIIIDSNIRQYRLKYGYTQAELARLIGVSKNAISDYENGKMLPCLTVSFCLVYLFNCTFYELFNFNCKFGAELLCPEPLNNYHIDEVLKIEGQYYE